MNSFYRISIRIIWHWSAFTQACHCFTRKKASKAALLPMWLIVNEFARTVATQNLLSRDWVIGVKFVILRPSRITGVFSANRSITTDCTHSENHRRNRAGVSSTELFLPSLRISWSGFDAYYQHMTSFFSLCNFGQNKLTTNAFCDRVNFWFDFANRQFGLETD